MVFIKDSYFTTTFRAIHVKICNGIISYSYFLLTAWLHSYKS